MSTFPNTDLHGVVKMFWDNYCLHRLGILVIVLLMQLKDISLREAGIGKRWPGYIFVV